MPPRPATNRRRPRDCNSPASLAYHRHEPTGEKIMADQQTIEVLLESFDKAFDARSWHGTNLRGSIRGVSRDEALWRPAPGRHNVWEVVLHASYWKYAVHRRLVGGVKRGSFPRGPSDWPGLPAPADAAAWKVDIALLEASHARLREAIAGFPPAALRRKKGSWRPFDQIVGIAAHDLYHAGQIQLLKRLQRG